MPPAKINENNRAVGINEAHSIEEFSSKIVCSIAVASNSCFNRAAPKPVSYTHLTLPTIYTV